jgi:hypothetical protein
MLWIIYFIMLLCVLCSYFVHFVICLFVYEFISVLSSFMSVSLRVRLNPTKVICMYIVCYTKTYNNWLTLWSWGLLERPLDVRLLDNFPTFHGTHRFNTEFTRALHLFLSLARPIQFTSPHPTSPTSILILSTHLRLGLPSGSFHLTFPQINYKRSSSPPFVLHGPSISSSTWLF